jgi:hypothetical protein
MNETYSETIKERKYRIMIRIPFLRRYAWNHATWEKHWDIPPDLDRILAIWPALTGAMREAPLNEWVIIGNPNGPKFYLAQRPSDQYLQFLEKRYENR